jgi:methyl-accepting chemotaxis protein
VTEVKRGSSETSAASGEVLTAARSLAHESDHLKNQVETFLDTVRTA